MDIQIQFIPHGDQRYDTCGDWFFSASGDLVIRVSQSGSDETDYAVAVHELSEALLCKLGGISQAEVDRWDMEQALPEEEPGANPAAPYHAEHCVAEAIERRFLEHTDVHWDEHEENINALGKTDAPDHAPLGANREA